MKGSREISSTKGRGVVNQKIAVLAALAFFMNQKIPVLSALAFVCGLLVFAFPMSAAASTVTVSIPNGSGSNTNIPGFSPATITVIVGVNNTVTWINNDNSPHTVTNLPASTGFDSGNMNAGDKFTHTFNTPGTYAITCDYHPWMKGTVVVLASSSTSSTSSSTVPEFPASALGATLLVAVVAMLLVSSRFTRKPSILH